MSRREACGLLLCAGLVLLGRWLRSALLSDADGAWRDPGWLAEHLPPPSPPAEPAPRGPRLPTAPLDPNTCPPDSLLLLPGVGPAIAGRIVVARGEGVHFACARDMQGIRGIGPVLAARIQPYLTFGQRDTTSNASMRSAR